jgi:hypothetical protein
MLVRGTGLHYRAAFLTALHISASPAVTQFHELLSFVGDVTASLPACLDKEIYVEILT